MDYLKITIEFEPDWTQVEAGLYLIWKGPRVDPHAIKQVFNTEPFVGTSNNH